MVVVGSMHARECQMTPFSICNARWFFMGYLPFSYSVIYPCLQVPYLSQPLIHPVIFKYLHRKVIGFYCCLLSFHIYDPNWFCVLSVFVETFSLMPDEIIHLPETLRGSGYTSGHSYTPFPGYWCCLCFRVHFLVHWVAVSEKVNN